MPRTLSAFAVFAATVLLTAGCAPDAVIDTTAMQAADGSVVPAATVVGAIALTPGASSDLGKTVTAGVSNWYAFTPLLTTHLIQLTNVTGDLKWELYKYDGTTTSYDNVGQCDWFDDGGSEACHAKNLDSVTPTPYVLEVRAFTLTGIGSYDLTVDL